MRARTEQFSSPGRTRLRSSPKSEVQDGSDDCVRARNNPRIRMPSLMGDQANAVTNAWWTRRRQAGADVAGELSQSLDVLA